MIASDPDENGWIHANDCLVSPPRNWPTSFKANKVLANFLNKQIKATKARLTQRPLDEILAEVPDEVKEMLSPVDCCINAQRVRVELGWPIAEGFAIYEMDDAPDIFVAKEHFWNLHPRDIWVDLTARDKHLADVLLVVTDVDAAFERAGLKRNKRPQMVAHKVLTAAAAAPTAESSATPPDISDLAVSDMPRSEYMEYWAPTTYAGSALASKEEFERSLRLPWGARCMLERATRAASQE